MRTTTILLASSVALIVAACSTEQTPSDGAVATTVSDVSLPPTTVIERGGTTTVVEAPVSFPPDADAEQVVAGLAPRLPMSEAERACVVQAVGADDELLGTLSNGVSPGTELFDRVVVVLQRCTVTATQAPLFAASVNENHGGTLAPDQLACLTNGFSALSSIELDSVMAAGLNPSDPVNMAGVDTLNSVLASCGVAVPAS